MATATSERELTMGPTPLYAKLLDNRKERERLQYELKTLDLSDQIIKARIAKDVPEGGKKVVRICRSKMDGGVIHLLVVNDTHAGPIVDQIEFADVDQLKMSPIKLDDFRPVPEANDDEHAFDCACRIRGRDASADSDQFPVLHTAS